MRNWVDSAIEFISPRAALRRESSRRALEVVREYDAGANGRRVSKLDRRSRSAVLDTISTLSKLRGFSRTLQQNNAYVDKAIDVRSRNIVGAGIRPAIVSGNKAVQKRAREVWKSWAETTACDYEGLQNIYGLQSLICTTLTRDGECIVIMRRDSSLEVPISLQVLEPDHLDDKKTIDLPSGNKIIQGVEFSGGKRVAYWIYEQHPNDSFLFGGGESKRIPAENVCHIFSKERPSQVRGVPMGVQSFLNIQDLSEFEDATLVQKKIAGCLVAFVTTMEGFKSQEEVEAASRMNPGTIHRLNPGESVEISKPPTSEGYAEYVRVNVQKIAIAYRVTYDSISSDLSNVNFSSGRMGWIESHQSFQDTQNRIMIPMFCEKVFNWFVTALDLKGIKGSLSATWTPPRRYMLDPSKETKGIVEAIRAGLTSWQEEAREQGWNIEELTAQIKEDKELAAQMGVTFTSDPEYGGKIT